MKVTDKSRIDSELLVEMRTVCTYARESGWARVEIDPRDAIALIDEVLESRKESQ